jgi:proline iminopeptidase
MFITPGFRLRTVFTVFKECTMTALYPEIEPFNTGLLDVGDGNHIYWEVCGNPAGKPVVVLHGGPGSGCNATMRRYFDPAAYRIVLFDQRNCGRSTPHASDPNVGLALNTTHHLLADMERLRQHLKVERWMLYGGSWGSTLALAYAERYPQRVTEIALVGVTMTRQSEIDWLYRGVAPLFPAQWVKFRAGVPQADPNADLVAAYYHRLHDSDPLVRAKAARDFHDWEFALLSIDPNAQPGGRWLDAAFQMARARIVTHYFYHRAWLEDGVLLREADKLAGIPGIMIHGRLDLGAPLVTPWELTQVWTDAELVIINNAGHSPGDPGMYDALIAATNRFARTLLNPRSTTRRHVRCL